MKRFLFLALLLVGLGLATPRVQAQSVGSFNVLCGGETIPATYDPQWPESSKKPALLGTCLNYLRDNNKAGARLRVQERNNQTGQPLSGGFDYSSNFCWCSNPTNPASCTVAPLLGANTAAECDTQCRNGNAVSRHFETTYRDYRGTTDSNKCGNYCWCMEPTAATGTETRCVLHRVTTRTVNGAQSQIPLTAQAECNTLCSGVTAGTRTGVAKHYETTYRDYSPYPTCNPTSGETPTSPNAPTTPTTRPSTPAPTVRLFNPMAGASTVVDIVNRIIKIMMGLVGAGALLMFVYGGIKWMTAGGDSKAVGDAQMILKNSTLGLLLLIFAYSIVSTFFAVLT